LEERVQELDMELEPLGVEMEPVKKERSCHRDIKKYWGEEGRQQPNIVDIPCTTPA
jgi:hypothetical protein